MTTQMGLARRVSALRERLSETAPEPHDRTAIPTDLARLHEVASKVSELQEKTREIEDSLPAIDPRAGERQASKLPAHLTWRSRRLLLEAKQHLEALKRAERDFDAADVSDPIQLTFRHTLAMCDLAIRAIQNFPEATAEQLRLCDGVESVLEVAGRRIDGLRDVLERRATERDRVESLGRSLLALAQGRPVVWKSLQDLADAILIDAGEPLGNWLDGRVLPRPEDRAAAHCLKVARVMARVVERDPEWRTRRRDAVLAALVYDAGMAAMPLDLLDQSEPLAEDQRRQIEAHVGLSAEGVKRQAPNEGWLVEAVRAHHERLDGTGYPTGAHGPQIPRLARLLAICDVYVALSTPRPHRAALSPRAALTETLLEAEKGRLDSGLAEYMLDLSFYPVGAVVELSDGQTGVVVAVNRMSALAPGGSELSQLNTPSRPVVQILLDEAGRPVPWPVHVNLAEIQGRHIVRSLTPDESRALLGPRHWHFA